VTENDRHKNGVDNVLRSLSHVQDVHNHHSSPLQNADTVKKHVVNLYRPSHYSGQSDASVLENRCTRKALRMPQRRRLAS